MNKAALLIAGVAAYAYYRYSKLSEVEKHELGEKWREKGKNLMKDFPGKWKNIMGDGKADKEVESNVFAPTY